MTMNGRFKNLQLCCAGTGFCTYTALFGSRNISIKNPYIVLLYSINFEPIYEFFKELILKYDMATIKEIEKRISGIEKRNKKVELDKAWETSITRKIIIAILTYIVIVLFFEFAGLPKPFINSIVP